MRCESDSRTPLTMLTKEQETWINHLSDVDKVNIVQFDPIVYEVFGAQKEELDKVLTGEKVQALHRGASSMGISGKGDVDIYIPVDETDFEQIVQKLKDFYGEPGSHYAKKRARWNKVVGETEVEIFVINRQDESWTKSVIFEDYLRTHPDALHEYRKLKEDANGTTVREYYRRKTEFINKILELSRDVSSA